MTLFRYSQKELRFIRTKYWRGRIIGIVLIALCLFIFINSIRTIKHEHEILVILAQHNAFSEEKLVKLIKDMNFRFPSVIYAQAILETGNFKSRVFIENNNLFGMHKATQRVTLSIGTESNYAYYNTWMESVYDYGFYYSKYLDKMLTEEEYFSYLQQYYAEDTEYVGKLRVIIENNKSKF